MGTGKSALESLEMNFWQDKKVLLTGHTGFKGSWLSIWLEHLGADVTGYALNPPTRPSLFELCDIDGMIDSIIGDIRDFKKLTGIVQAVKPDIIIHMAAQPIVRESYKDPRMTYETNVMGTVNLLEAARNSNSVKAIVNVTTDKCYENKETLQAYKENDALGGFDPYSNSKACSELVTASYRRSFFEQSGISIATARAGNVIGGGDWACDRLIPDFVRALLNDEKIRVRNPKAVRPWQHVLEPLSGYMLLAEKLYKHGQKYASAWNFGPDRVDAKPVEWIVKSLCKKWEGASYSIDKDEHPHEAHYLLLDHSKSTKLLGWKPKWHLDRAIDKVVEWTKAYQEKENDLYDICLSQIKEYTRAR
jgi:CDP-glucose 4,6-dehydratase